MVDSREDHFSDLTATERERARWTQDSGAAVGIFLYGCIRETDRWTDDGLRWEYPGPVSQSPPGRSTEPPQSRSRSERPAGSAGRRKSVRSLWARPSPYKQHLMAESDSRGVRVSKYKSHQFRVIVQFLVTPHLVLVDDDTQFSHKALGQAGAAQRGQEFLHSLLSTLTHTPQTGEQRRHCGLMVHPEDSRQVFESHDLFCMYSGEHIVLIPCRFCTFATWQKNDQSIILMVGLFEQWETE